MASNGMNTAHECFIAGLDPTDPQSRFAIHPDFSSQTDESVIGWNATSGRVYSVWFATNLMSGFQCLESNIPWTQTSFTNQTDTASGYYKISVELEE